MSGKRIIVTLVVFLLCANVLLLVYLGVIESGAGARVQDATELRGIVADEAHAVIADAFIALDGNGRGYSTQSDERGRFRFVGIKPGIYALTVSVKGFAKFTQQ